MEVDTETDSVVKAYHNWIGLSIKEYRIDSLRIGAPRDIRANFWQPFVADAGVSSTGGYTAAVKGPLDSVVTSYRQPRRIYYSESPLLKQRRRLIGTYPKILDYWGTSWTQGCPALSQPVS